MSSLLILVNKISHFKYLKVKINIKLNDLK
jgi:hypothetical protein